MNARQSFYVIVLLLIALVFGPAVVMAPRAGERSLRPLAPQERIVDAPAPLPGPPAPSPAPFFRR